MSIPFWPKNLNVVKSRFQSPPSTKTKASFTPNIQKHLDTSTKEIYIGPLASTSKGRNTDFSNAKS